MPRGCSVSEFDDSRSVVFWQYGAGCPIDLTKGADLCVLSIRHQQIQFGIQRGHNMKALILLAAVTVLCGCSRHESTAVVGRYEIRPANYDSAEISLAEPPKVSTKTRHGVFKIDTVTGRTWIYTDQTLSSTNKVTTYSGWEEITGTNFLPRLD